MSCLNPRNRHADDCNLLLVFRCLKALDPGLQDCAPFKLFLLNATRHDQVDLMLTIIHNDDSSNKSASTDLLQGFWSWHLRQSSGETDAALRVQKHQDALRPDLLLLKMPTKRQRLSGGELLQANGLRLSREIIYQLCLAQIEHTSTEPRHLCQRTLRLADSRKVRAASSTSLEFELISTRPDDCSCHLSFFFACQAFARLARETHSPAKQHRLPYTKLGVYCPNPPQWPQAFHGFVVIRYS